MRISDWSSDVCSSDLREARPGLVCRPKRVCDLFSEKPLQCSKLRDSWPLASQPRGPCPAAGDAENGKWTHSSVRSEEHTSELQSLMRNSYAVFCLKKKKKYSYNIHKISYKN